MKKKNIILVGLLSISLLTGCTTDKIERSQQDIKQEKVEKAKKEIASESKKKASSTILVIPNSNESTQTESTQTESTQETTTDQQVYPNAIAPSWWRECNANGHRVSQGFDTQSGKYYWCCNDCGKAVCYEICNEHNTPATPEHMQLHLN